MNIHPKHLGQNSSYITQYRPDLLEVFPRLGKREEINIYGALPFFGEDIWNLYEISWLNPKGKPMVAIGECRVPCTSPHLIESKSFKLYLNSFNQTVFSSLREVTEVIRKDLSSVCGQAVSVMLTEPKDSTDSLYSGLPGTSIDALDIECTGYEPQPSILKTNDKLITEILTSDLLKSNCLVTGQPDWGSVQITYTGPQIDRASLLKYIVGFREHNEFHEQCVERIFIDLLTHCKPSELTVYARYTRRGGLDINPYRSTQTAAVCPNIRLIRQ